jgi:hypothetical protein
MSELDSHVNNYGLDEKEYEFMLKVAKNYNIKVEIAIAALRKSIQIIGKGYVHSYLMEMVGYELINWYNFGKSDNLKR